MSPPSLRVSAALVRVQFILVSQDLPRWQFTSEVTGLSPLGVCPPPPYLFTHSAFNSPLLGGLFQRALTSLTAPADVLSQPEETNTHGHLFQWRTSQYCRHVAPQCLHPVTWPIKLLNECDMIGGFLYVFFFFLH